MIAHNHVRTSISLFKYSQTSLRRIHYLGVRLEGFDCTEILYGIIRNNSIEITLNHIILIAKYHIYCNATSNAIWLLQPFLNGLKTQLKLRNILLIPLKLQKWRRIKLLTLLYRKKGVNM